jgi:predicted enzyme related to lactoylglutathione lyase
MDETLTIVVPGCQDAWGGEEYDMKVTRHKPGAPCWVDLGSPDVPTSTAFYTQLFGWTAQTVPDPAAGGYTFFQKGDDLVAAVGPLSGDGQAPAWNWYAATLDADETARRVEAAGGKILSAPFNVLDAGRMAVFLDTSGAQFSVWQAGQMAGAGVIQEPGSLMWVELMTRDPDGATEFYTRVFGWGTEVSTDPAAPYTQFQVDEESIAGMMPMIGDQWPAELPDHWMVYFGVGDVDAAAALVPRLGGTVGQQPTDIPGVGRFAIFSDPSGAYFSVLKMAG